MFNRFQLGTKSVEYLAKSKLEDSTAVVLLKGMYHLNKNNMIVGSPKEIALDLGITMWDFDSGMRTLKQYDCVRKFTKREYMINPDVIYVGNRYDVAKFMWDNQTSRGLRK